MMSVGTLSYFIADFYSEKFAKCSEQEQLVILNNSNTDGLYCLSEKFIADKVGFFKESFKQNIIDSNISEKVNDNFKDTSIFTLIMFPTIRDAYNLLLACKFYDSIFFTLGQEDQKQLANNLIAKRDHLPEIFIKLYRNAFLKYFQPFRFKPPIEPTEGIISEEESQKLASAMPIKIAWCAQIQKYSQSNTSQVIHITTTSSTNMQIDSSTTSISTSTAAPVGRNNLSSFFQPVAQQAQTIQPPLAIPNHASPDKTKS